MRYLTFLLPVIFFMTACGGGDSDNQQQAEATAQAADDQSNDGRIIKIIGIDQMKFVVKDDSQSGITTGQKIDADGLLLLEAITVEPGEQITVQLTTQSKLPAMAMSHNFILFKRSADIEAFDKAAAKAKDNDYIPSDLTEQILAHTGLASGGETVEVTFTAPQETGSNEFICSFPGHYASGMKGTLNVQ